MRGELSMSLGQPRYKGPYFDTQKTTNSGILVYYSHAEL